MIDLSVLKKKTKELMISYVSSFYYQDVDSRALG